MTGTEKSVYSNRQQINMKRLLLSTECSKFVIALGHSISEDDSDNRLAHTQSRCSLLHCSDWRGSCGGSSKVVWNKK